MRYVVFSDIHGNYIALKKMLEDIKDIPYDKLIFLGDVFGYYYNQKEVLNTLSGVRNLEWLLGNHDNYFINLISSGSIEYLDNLVNKYGHSYEKCFRDDSLQAYASMLKSLNSGKCLLDDNGIIGAFHGTPKDYLEGRLYPNDSIDGTSAYCRYDIILLGHTHFRMFRKCNESIIINPGSLGQPRDGCMYSYCILNTADRKVEFRDIQIDERLLLDQINTMDPSLVKLYEVLKRTNGQKKSTCYRYQW